MRAFLSHSSKNKILVRGVYSNLGPSLAEFDEETFQAGDFNLSVIEASLSRTELFVLFATKESIESGYVEFEVMMAQEYLAQKKIKKIITFCLDDVRPESLTGILPNIAAVRKVTSPGAIARTIRSILVDMSLENGDISRPFVGREEEKYKISTRLSDAENSTPAALMLSGVDGVGRRTLAKKVFEDIYPYLPRIHPSINVISGSGAPEIYRELLSLTSILSKSALFEELKYFDGLSDQEKFRKILEKIEEICNQDQILFVIDDGGTLLDDGSLNDVLSYCVRNLSQKSLSHPPLCLITFRTPPGKAREKSGVLYHRVDPLASNDIRMLVSLHFKRKKIKIDGNQIDKIVDLIDGHPYNLEYVLDLLDSTSVESILDDPSDMIAFKMRQGDEFLSRMKLSAAESSVLSALRVLGTTPIQILSEVLSENPLDLGGIVKSLEERHCIERSGGVVSINRPLRLAIERSPQLRLTKVQIAQIREKAVEVFKEFHDGDDIPISLISTAARAAALSNDEDANLRLFISPANAVLVARQLYDAKSYGECETMCERALGQVRLITPEAALEARRLRCLSLIRLGRDDDFQDEVLKIDTQTKRGAALEPFLRGFRQRIRGYPSEACSLFEVSLRWNSDGFSTLRELAHSWLLQGKPEKAKIYCDRALQLAPTNPYVLDQALAIELSQRAKVDSYIFYDPVVEKLLERLSKYGNEEGLSFYSIRMADICRRSGDSEGALEHLQEAKRLNPSHVPAFIMECEILLSRGEDPSRLDQKVESIRPMIDGNRSGEGNTNLPEFLVLKIKVLAELGRARDAVRLLRLSHNRLGGRVPDLKKQLAFSVNAAELSDPADIEFLKS